MVEKFRSIEEEEGPYIRAAKCEAAAAFNSLRGLINVVKRFPEIVPFSLEDKDIKYVHIGVIGEHRPLKTVDESIVQVLTMSGEVEDLPEKAIEGLDNEIRFSNMARALDANGINN